MFLKATKRLSLIILASLALLSCVSGFGDIRVESGKIDNFRVGLDGSAEVEATLEISNPARYLVVSDVSGVLKIDGSPLLNFSCPEPVRIPRGVDQVSLKVIGTRAEGVSLLSLIPLLRESNLSKMKADVSAKVGLKCGFGKTIEYKDIRVDDLLGL